MRKITLFFAVLFATMTAFSATLYLSPNANWKTDNARYAAYFFGNGESWVSMTDSNSDGVYEVEAPAGYPNVIFCRMNPSTTANNWNNKWNQTGDLKVPTDNKVKFVVPDGVWDGAGATCWVELDNNGPVVLPESWTVAGSSTALFGSEWAPSNEANDLTKGADGVWTKFYDDVTLTAGTIEYKIVKSHVWGEAYPADNAKLSIPAAGKYDVTFTFNATTHAVNATAEAVVETPKPATTVTWSIAEGAELDGFAEVIVTFAGTDSVGRKFDGVEVLKAVAQGSSTNQLFYSVDEAGNRTPVAGGNGLMYAKTEGLSIVYSLANKGYDLVDNKFMPKGNYCIVIDAGDVLFTPNRTSPLPKVFNDKEYVLNFTIENDYTEPVKFVEVDAAFTANPADNSTVKSLSTIVLTFTDKTPMAIGELGETPRPDVWPFLNQVMTGGNDDELGGTIGGMAQPVAPMHCELTEGTTSVQFSIASELIEGVTEITTEGTYTFTIPAGVIKFSETEINKAITLNYTVKSTGTDVDYTTIANIYTVGGMIMAEGEIQIFTVTGQNVTDMNGNLQNGVYVVKSANATTKVIIK
jgi:hypothetical protein